MTPFTRLGVSPRAKYVICSNWVFPALESFCFYRRFQQYTAKNKKGTYYYVYRPTIRFQNKMLSLCSERWFSSIFFCKLTDSDHFDGRNTIHRRVYRMTTNFSSMWDFLIANLFNVKQLRDKWSLDHMLFSAEMSIKKTFSDHESSILCWTFGPQMRILLFVNCHCDSFEWEFCSPRLGLPVSKPKKADSLSPKEVPPVEKTNVGITWSCAKVLNRPNQEQPKCYTNLNNSIGFRGIDAWNETWCRTWQSWWRTKEGFLSFYFSHFKIVLINRIVFVAQEQKANQRRIRTWQIPR